MHIFSVQKAAKDLKDNRFSEWQKTQYLLASFVLTLVYSAAGGFFPQEFAFQTYAKSVGYLISAPLIYLTVRHLFLINEKFDDSDFIGRFTILGFPAFVQSILLSWLIYLIALLISFFIPFGEFFTEIFSVIFPPVFYLIYYLRLKTGFKILCA